MFKCWRVVRITSVGWCWGSQVLVGGGDHKCWLVVGIISVGGWWGLQELVGCGDHKCCWMVVVGISSVGG